MTNNTDPKTKTLAETENYIAWKSDEPDGETIFHIEANAITLHFFKEEWNEFVELMKAIKE